MTTRTISRSGVNWTIPRYKLDWRKICALMPSYLDDGTNGTAITYLDNSIELIAYRLQWVLDDLLGYLRTSRDVLTRQSKQYLGRNARRVPLLVSPEFSLVPVKGREAIGAYDSVSGYVVLEHVADVIPYGKTNRIYFNGGRYLNVYDSTRKVWENLNLTKEMKLHMEELQCQSTQLHCPVA